MPSPRTNPQPLRVKERPAYPTQLPPAFWDNLSEVPLTKNALRELERRKPRRPGTQPNTAQCLDYYNPTARERIKRFARIGGPDLSDLRGYCHEPCIVLELGMSERQSHLGRRKRGSASASESTPTLPPTSTPKTGPYDRAFQQLLIDYGIYPNKYEYPDGQALPPPGNLEEIIQAIVKPRPSLSLSRLNQEDFERFERADSRARKEWQVISDVIPIIEGEVRDGSYVFGQVPFTNLEDPTGGLLVPGNPDRCYGARPEQLDRQVRMQLNKHIVPSTQHDLPIVPNFFLNVKGPDGTQAVAERQACYDGALGARGMNSLQTYSDPKSNADNKAYTLTSTYYGGQLKIYATYPLAQASPETPREYAMMQVKAYALTSDVDTFRIGVSAYRNARDWAKQKRDEAIQRANETAAQDNKRDTLLSSSNCNLSDTTTLKVDKDTDIDIPPAKRARGGQ
ncbi:hypothetical protein F5Y03DRAFT_404499 [Xylaria venustula]|nr:hypothetical protein F5Y03DRAFT_404499 [Xylaria venustula]